MLQDNPDASGRTLGKAAATGNAGALGDWFGVKPKKKLRELGIEVSALDINEAGLIYSGGKRSSPAVAGQFMLTFDADMAKLAGMPGGRVRFGINRRYGVGLDPHAGLRTLQPTIEVHGRGNVLRLTTLWYEQSFAGDTVRWKIGRSNPGEDFATFSCDFMNVTFCGSQPTEILDRYWVASPISMWSTRVRVQMRALYAQIGAYEINPRNLDERFSLGHLHGATGVLIPVEAGWTHGGNGDGLVGVVKVGAFVSTADQPDALLDKDHRPVPLTGQAALLREGSSGFYLSIEQQVTGRTANGQAISGVTLFFNGTKGDRRTARIEDQMSFGMFLCGLFAPRDTIGLAVGRTHINPRFAETERLSGREAPRSEYAVEFNYKMRPVTWLAIQPSLQWVKHAGGYQSSKNVAFAGVKTVLTF
ncbi:porin [Sphingobium sp. AP50]|nr:porin [Sphingobium sp. AP50]